MIKKGHLPIICKQGKKEIPGMIVPIMGDAFYRQVTQETGIRHMPYFPAHKKHFFPKKCDLNLNCVLCAEVPNLEIPVQPLYNIFIIRE
jgi:hypothetical protein